MWKSGVIVELSFDALVVLLSGGQVEIDGYTIPRDAKVMGVEVRMDREPNVIAAKIWADGLPIVCEGAPYTRVRAIPIVEL